MRVAILIEQFFPVTGGGERQMQALGKALKRRGFEVCVVTRRFSGLAKCEDVEGLSVHRLSLPVQSNSKSILGILLRKLNGVVFLLSTLKFLAVRGNQPQIVLIQGGIAFVDLMKLPLIASVLRIISRQMRVVLKPWNRPWTERTGEPSISVVRPDKDRNSQLAATLFKFVCNHTDSFVAVTDAIWRELVKDGVPNGKIARIPNGVDTRSFMPVSASERRRAKASLGLSDARLVTYVGSLKRQKGLNILLEAWRQVGCSRCKAHLLIVGRTWPEDEFRYLAGLAQTLGVEDSVTFTGQTHDVRKYLCGTDVFVLPSFLEGLSNAMLEAFSSSLPVVVTDVPGVGDAVVSGSNGLVVPAGDADALAKSILTLLDDQRRAVSLGEAARETAVQRYSIDTVAARYEELFTALA